MKKILVLFCFLMCCGRLMAQRNAIDSMRHALALAKTESAKNLVKTKLMRAYHEYYADSGIYYANMYYAEGKSTNDQELTNNALHNLAYSYYIKGNFPAALNNAFYLLRRIENGKNAALVADDYNTIGNIYKGQQNYPKALYYYQKCKGVAMLHGDTTDLTFSYFNIANIYDLTNVPDSVIIYATKALKFVSKVDNAKQVDIVLAFLGDGFAKKGDSKMAYSYLRKAYVQTQNTSSHKRNSSVVCTKLSQYFKGIGQQDSAIYYADKALNYAKSIDYKNYEYISARLLHTLYQDRHNIDSAYKYLLFSSAINDSLYNTQRVQESEALTIAEKDRLNDIEQAKETYKNNIKISLLISGLVIFLVIAGFLWRNNRQKQTANSLLNAQKQEIASQRDELEIALKDLKLTQTQLIQSEKMASLGELTAGIAHEIQNPLNFVNNFSDVSIELLEELKEEEEKGNKGEVIAIAGDLTQNLEKIRHHGRRADAIVKGMLQHSRTSSGQKEQTDLNALADEYLRLAYHGLRAKDREFNVDLITQFDDQLPKVNVIPQDIGRVLLNIINNALYAVQQKAKTAGTGYKPEVSVTILAKNGNVVIKVRDNGTGMPESVKEKIMQPFFTTKPTGEGTGLGLSLTYDIVVKGLGGSIEVNTKEDEFTQLDVVLPVG